MKKIICQSAGWLIVTVCAFAPLSVQATDGTFNNLTVTGLPDIQSDSLLLGTNTSTSAQGFTLGYTDGTTSYLDFEGSRSANVWRWWQNSSGTLKLQLTLDNNNKLILFDQSTTPVAKITLDPLGTSTFVHSVTLSGTDNEMPNQTLVGANSVLTEGLADTRYLSSSAATLMLFGGAATGTNAIALGYSTTASGNYSFASGYGSQAVGDNSTAMGFWAYAGGTGSTAVGISQTYGLYSTALGSAVATGDYSMATGVYSNASGYASTATGDSYAEGDYSTALGTSTAGGYASLSTGSSNAEIDYSTALGTSTADGYASLSTGSSYAGGDNSMATGGSYTVGIYSTALGYSGAGGDYSTSMGLNSSAASYNSVAMGQYNLGGGDTSDWVGTDPLLEVGNGTDSDHLSDALIVYKNGNAAIQSQLTVGGVVTAAPGGDIPMFSGE